MPRQITDKCRLCAKLTAEQAQQKHGEGGTAGDNCWNPDVCPQRRSYYRHRDTRNQGRRRRRQATAALEPSRGAAAVSVGLPAIAVPYAVLHFYRQTKESRIHAVGGELWVGNERVAKAVPVHCLGLANEAMKTVLLRILEGFSQAYGQPITKFTGDPVELDPQNCPLRPCPLLPEIGVDTFRIEP